MGEEAGKLRDLLEGELYDQLQARQRKTRATADQIRDRVAEHWRQLARLRTEFVQNTGAIR